MWTDDPLLLKAAKGNGFKQPFGYEVKNKKMLDLAIIPNKLDSLTY